MAEELTLFPLEFNRSIRIEARDEHLSADPGTILVREAMEHLGIVAWLVARLTDARNPERITHPFSELLRTELVRLAQGWRDHDDADALRDDPAFRLAVSDRKSVSPLERRPDEERLRNHNPPVPDGLASQPTLSRLARELSGTDNRGVLRDGLLEVTARRIRAEHRGHRIERITLDIDSLPIEVHGHQPGSAYNGHYHARIYHPIIVSIAQTGDLIGVWLREGTAHTAAGTLDWLPRLLDAVERLLGVHVAVRIDAGFPEEKLLGGLEARPTRYVARIRNNPVLDRMAAPHVRRPPGRRTDEPREWAYEMEYRAEAWSRARRVVLVVQERVGELYLHYFWLITNWTAQEMPATALLEEYRQRGSAEGHMGELMDVFDPALSSSPRPKSHYRGEVPEHRTASGDSFAINEALLLLNALAYNITHVLRLKMAKATGEGWSLRRLVERVLRTAARVIVHERRATIVIGCRRAARLWRALLCELPFLRAAAAVPWPAPRAAPS